MWMPLKQSLLVSTVIGLSACAHDTQVIASVPQACPSIAADSSILIKIYSDLTYWNYYWNKGGITLTEHGQDKSQVILNDNDASVLNQFSDVVVPGDPNHYSLDIPAVLSPNGKYLLGTLRTKTIESYEIGIFDISSHKLMNAINLSRPVTSVAWSPDSQSYAVLERDDVSAIRSPKDATVAALGWKIHYYDVYLEIGSLEGKPKCTTQVASQLAQMTGYLRWIKKN